MTIGFKVVRQRNGKLGPVLSVLSRRRRSGKRIRFVYQEGKPIMRKPGCGPYAVFAGLEDAMGFIRSWKRVLPADRLILFRVEYTLSKAKAQWISSDRWTELTPGTVLADSFRLI